MKRLGHIAVSPWQTRIDKTVFAISLVALTAALIIEHTILKGSL